MLHFQIKKSLGTFQLDVDVQSSSRILGLFGPSGSGKTTVLNCLAGTATPDEGAVRIGETTWFDSQQSINTPVRQRRVGYVFQDGLLFEHMSVLKNMTYGFESNSRGPKLQEVVDILGIGDLLERRPCDLSGGQRRLVAVGRALLRHPLILLLDEPLTGLDAPLAGRVIVSLKRVLEQFDIAAVYVSHAISDVIYFCHEAVVLREGRVIAQGPPTQVIARQGVLDEQHLAELRNVFVVESAGAADGDVSRFRVGAHELTVYARFEGAAKSATLAVRACDIMLATRRPEGISARNILPGRVTRIEPVGSKVIVFVDVGLTWMVEVGRAAVTELGLQPEREVFVIIKASAISVL